MKKYLPLVFIIVSLTPLNLFAQTNVNRPDLNIKMDFKTDGNSVASFYPFALATSNFALSWEQKISEKSSFKGVLALGLSDYSTVLDIRDYSNYYVEGQIRYFPLHHSPSGFYSGLYLNERNSSFIWKYYDYTVYPYSTYVDKSYSLNAIGGGVIMGVQMFMSKVVSVDFYAGGGPNIPSTKLGDNETGIAFQNFRKGINPHFGLSIGMVLK